VFSPFAGIGSEGFEAIKAGRRFYGCELKREYYDAALMNLERAKQMHVETLPALFGEVPQCV
jgi:DNA modification methylase